MSGPVLVTAQGEDPVIGTNWYEGWEVLDQGDEGSSVAYAAAHAMHLRHLLGDVKAADRALRERYAAAQQADPWPGVIVDEWPPRGVFDGRAVLAGLAVLCAGHPALAARLD